MQGTQPYRHTGRDGPSGGASDYFLWLVAPADAFQSALGYMRLLAGVHASQAKHVPTSDATQPTPSQFVSALACMHACSCITLHHTVASCTPA